MVKVGYEIIENELISLICHFHRENVFITKFKADVKIQKSLCRIFEHHFTISTKQYYLTIINKTLNRLKDNKLDFAVPTRLNYFILVLYREPQENIRKGV